MNIVSQDVEDFIKSILSNDAEKMKGNLIMLHQSLVQKNELILQLEQKVEQSKISEEKSNGSVSSLEDDLFDDVTLPLFEGEEMIEKKMVNCMLPSSPVVLQKPEKIPEQSVTLKAETVDENKNEETLSAIAVETKKKMVEMNMVNCMLPSSPVVLQEPEKISEQSVTLKAESEDNKIIEQKLPLNAASGRVSDAPVSNGEEMLIKVEAEKSVTTDESAESDQDDSAESDSDEISSYLPSFCVPDKKVIQEKDDKLSNAIILTSSEDLQQGENDPVEKGDGSVQKTEEEKKSSSKNKKKKASKEAKLRKKYNLQKIELEEMRLALEKANMDKADLSKKLDYYKNDNDSKNNIIIKLKQDAYIKKMQLQDADKTKSQQRDSINELKENIKTQELVIKEQDLINKKNETDLINKTTEIDDLKNDVQKSKDELKAAKENFNEKMIQMQNNEDALTQKIEQWEIYESKCIFKKWFKKKPKRLEQKQKKT